MQLNCQWEKVICVSLQTAQLPLHVRRQRPTKLLSRIKSCQDMSSRQLSRWDSVYHVDLTFLYLCGDCYTYLYINHHCIKLIDQVTLPVAQRPKTCETRCTWPAALPLTRAWQWFRVLRGHRLLMPGQVHKSVHSSRILGAAWEILVFLLRPWFRWAHQGNIMIIMIT